MTILLEAFDEPTDRPTIEHVPSGTANSSEATIWVIKLADTTD